VYLLFLVGIRIERDMWIPFGAMIRYFLNIYFQRRANLGVFWKSLISKKRTLAFFGSDVSPKSEHWLFLEMTYLARAQHPCFLEKYPLKKAKVGSFSNVGDLAKSNDDVFWKLLISFRMTLIFRTTQCAEIDCPYKKNGLGGISVDLPSTPAWGLFNPRPHNARALFVFRLRRCLKV
tara:strand:+ start:447 stop:977 length:531 start_codon:yes stop_codon:yes gene_type:complete